MLTDPQASRLHLTTNISANEDGDIPLNEFFYPVLHQGDPGSCRASGQTYLSDVTADSTRTAPPPNNYPTQGLYQIDAESHGGGEQIYAPDVTTDSTGTVPLRDYFTSHNSVTQSFHQNDAECHGGTINPSNFLSPQEIQLLEFFYEQDLEAQGC